MKLTGFELNTIENLMNNPQRGGAIKDLRLIKKTISKIRKAQPKLPIEPTAPTKGSPEATSEDMKVFEEKHKEWVVEMEKLHDTEYDCELGQMYEIVIKSRLASYNQFNNDERIRDRVLALADKFGI